MKLKDLFKRWGLEKLKVKTPILDLEWAPNDPDKNAAWELYIELLTRITTQRLPEEHGDEKTALDSVFSLFKTTREVLKRNGRECVQFTRIAVIVLNQIVRPFTAKWHRLSLEKAFDDKEKCKTFRIELIDLQNDLLNYTKMLADMADVEDLTELEQ
jgi:hypothetical protein